MSADARSRRRYVERAAEALCRRRPAPAALEGVSWDALATLPPWCLLEDDAVLRLRTLCGAVYLLPAIHGSTHGAFLRRVRDCIGEPAFGRLLRSGAGALPRPDLEPEGELPDRLGSAGAAVLLGTLAEPAARAVFLPLLGRPLGFLPASIAEPVYLLAARIEIDPTARAA